MSINVYTRYLSEIRIALAVEKKKGKDFKGHSG